MTYTVTVSVEGTCVFSTHDYTRVKRVLRACVPTTEKPVVVRLEFYTRKGITEMPGVIRTISPILANSLIRIIDETIREEMEDFYTGVRIVVKRA